MLQSCPSLSSRVETDLNPEYKSTWSGGCPDSVSLSSYLTAAIMASEETENTNPKVWEAAVMADHFEKIQKLPDKLDGVPNLRRVPGYKVYCCGQPTIAGFERCLEKVTGTLYPRDGKIIWLNMRQEPIVYVDGNPMCARPSNKIGEYAELGNVTAEDLEVDEKEFLRVVNSRIKNADGKLDYVDVDKKKHSVEAKKVVTLSAVVEKLKEKYPKLVHLRVPICNSASPLEQDYDTILSALVGSGVSSPVIVNCQVIGQLNTNPYQRSQWLKYSGRSLPLHHRLYRRLYVQGVSTRCQFRGFGGNCARGGCEPPQDGQVQDGL